VRDFSMSIKEKWREVERERGSRGEREIRRTEV
jgi:hypothetical protein